MTTGQKHLTYEEALDRLSEESKERVRAENDLDKFAKAITRARKTLVAVLAGKTSVPDTQITDEIADEIQGLLDELEPFDLDAAAEKGGDDPPMRD